MNLIKNKEYNRLFLPLATEQVFLALIANVNVFLLSTYNDTAIAAMGLAEQALSTGGMLMGIVSLGSTIVFLQNADEKHLPYVQVAFRASMLLNIILAFLLILVFTIFSPHIISLIQTPKELKQSASAYLFAISFSLIFQGISATLHSILRSFGHVKVTTKISVLTTILVIGANAVLVLTPLIDILGGIKAIAVSTVIMRGVGALIALIVMYKKLPEITKEVFHFSKKDARVIKDILVLGVPSSMENVSYNFSQTIIVAVIATLGTVAITAKMYAQTITSMIFTLAVAAGQASQIIIGKYFREKDFTTAKNFGAGHARFVWACSVCLNIIIAIFSLPLIKLFTSNSDIIHLGVILLVLSILYNPMRCVNEVLISTLNLTGDVMFPVFLGVAVTYLFTVPAVFLGVKFLYFGIINIWIVFIIDESFRAIIFYRRWKLKFKEDMNGK